VGVTFTCLPEMVTLALYVFISGVTWDIDAAIIAETLMEIGGQVFEAVHLTDVKSGSTLMGGVAGRILLKHGMVFDEDHEFSMLNDFLDMGGRIDASPSGLK
jgi:hypothetical protein